MKIAIGGVVHETNTFSSVLTTVDFFKLYEWEYGSEIIENHSGVNDYLGGMIAKGNELGIEIIPTFWASANAAGLITRDAYQQLVDNLLDSVDSAFGIDGICLALHGAGLAEGTDDLEGSILQKLREALGDDIPIVATLDLHANLTETMINEADALFGVNFYPHTDCFDRGKEAMENLVKMVHGEIKPVMHVEKLPMMIPAATTDLSPAKDINELCWKMEALDSVIDCTFFHGFSQTDIPDMRAGVLAITDNGKELAEKIAKQCTEKVWELREEFYIDLPGPKEGIEQAFSQSAWPVVINETSDNPGAGAPGDGTHLLKALIEKNEEGTCFGFIYDPETAELAHKTGVGNVMDAELGGKTDALHGSPLKLRVYIKTLTDGQFVHTHPMYDGKKVNMGKTARLRAGNVDIIVVSKRAQTLDEQIFLLHGIDVEKYKVIALKSENHFRASFSRIAKKIITVDSPGLSTFNLRNYHYKRVQRPVLPLDPFE